MPGLPHSNDIMDDRAVFAHFLQQSKGMRLVHEGYYAHNALQRQKEGKALMGFRKNYLFIKRCGSFLLHDIRVWKPWK